MITEGITYLMIKNVLRKIIPIRVRLFRSVLVRKLRVFYYRKDLSQLALIHNTDKWGGHWYTQHYQHHFKKFRTKKINILEIGVGGHKDPSKGGASLRMWKNYFTRANIYSLDIYDKSIHEEHRIKIYKGSQIDEVFLRKICDEAGGFDLIMDDGSHVNSHVIQSFEILFEHLRKGGIYAVEDMQTSYYPQFGGDSENIENKVTMMNYFKAKLDSLNHVERIKPGYEPTYFDKNIVSMHFYHNLMFIYKDDNNEESNMVKFNKEIKKGAGEFAD